MKPKEDTFKVYITKYALTKKGILEREVYFCLDTDPKMVADLKGNTYENGEWYKKLIDATIKAYEMKKAKISELKKQITKLQKIFF